MHQKRTRPETMPAYTHKHGEPKTNTRTDKRQLTTQRWVFGPPESSCLPVHGLPYRMASTVHQTWNQERNSPIHRAGCLPAHSLASVLRLLERPIRSPFIESFLLCRIPSCFSAGPRIYTGLSCPAWARVLYLSFPSVLEVFSFPSQGIPDEPPTVMPDVRIPEREERRLPRQCNSQKGKLIADSSQGSCRIQRSGAGSESLFCFLKVISTILPSFHWFTLLLYICYWFLLEYF